MADKPVKALTFQQLHEAVAHDSAALRVLTRLAPVGGEGDKIFPPTYRHPDRDQSLYALETRRIDGKEVRAVLLDSAASQANRLEEALLRAFERGECDVPVLSVTIPRGGLTGPTRVTALDAPHRLTDAIFRDSTLDGKGFRDSPLGKRLMEARLHNATAVFQSCPSALLFGFWDSQAGAGIHGAKVARALVSEIIGLDAVPGQKTSSRIDPAGITANAAKIYKSDTEMWTLDEKAATKEKGKPVLFGKASKAGKPSAINHGNVAPTVSATDEPGGVTISAAIQTTVVSLPQLRRLRFPSSENGKTTTERDVAGQTVLAALALYAIALQRQDGYFLRSRCHLIPVEAPKNELLGATAQDVHPFQLDIKAGKQVFEEAREHARKAGLAWEGGFIELQPAGKLVELVRRSDEKTQLEGGDDNASA